MDKIKDKYILSSNLSCAVPITITTIKKKENYLDIFVPWNINQHKLRAGKLFFKKNISHTSDH